MSDWKPASIPPPHRKDVLIQEKDSELMYVGHYNSYTKKYIFLEFGIEAECWMELPEPFTDEKGKSQLSENKTNI